MLFSAERRQPRTNCASFARTCGVAAFGRAAAGRAQRPDGGGQSLVLQALFEEGAFFRTPANRKQGLLQGYFSIGRGFDSALSRRVYDRDHEIALLTEANSHVAK